MFNFFKKVFTKKVTSTENINNNKNLQITFQDRKLQQINIKLQPSGNETVLIIKENKSKVEIALDRELSLIVASILQEYATTNNINKTIELIKRED